MIKINLVVLEIQKAEFGDFMVLLLFEFNPPNLNLKI